MPPLCPLCMFLSLLPEEKWCGTQTSIRLDGFFTPNRNVFEVRALQRAKLEETRLYAWIPGWERKTSPRVNAPEALGCTAAVQASDIPLLHLRDWRSPGAAIPPPNLPRQTLFLPSLPHYLLPLTSASWSRGAGGWE